MAILGAHLSIAGGYHKAVEAAADLAMDCVQIFTAPPQQWPKLPVRRAKKAPLPPPIADADAARFRAALRELRIGHPLAHSSYLINLAAPKPALWRKSVAAFVEELRRAAALQIPYVVLHPGAFTESDETAGLKAIIRALDEARGQTHGSAVCCLLETTAGQGTCLGHRFEHLATILAGVQDPDWLGVCFDTCHVFAAGYPLADAQDYRNTMRACEQTIGLEKIKAFHLNDSKRELGSRVDRHEHIGRGRLGLEPFRRLLNDPRFRHVPMYLETPKGDCHGRPWDAVNLETLRSLAKGA